MKLQKKIIFSIMGGMLVGFSAFLGINHTMMQETATAEINDKLKVKTSDLANNIEEWLETKQLITESLKKQVQALDDQSPDNVRRYLHFAIDVAKVDAAMVYYKGKNLIHTDTNWNLTSEEEEKNMPYQMALANNFHPAISKIFKSPINKIDNMIVIIAPFNYDSLATLVVEIKDIEEKVAKTKFEGAYAILVDADKKILVHPDPKFQGKMLSENIPELKWLEDKSFAQKSGLSEYTQNGQAYITVFDTIAATGWKVVINFEKDVAFARANAQTKKLLMISISFFILSTLFILAINAFHDFWRGQVEKKNDNYEFILAHRSRLSEIGELISGINHQLNQPLNSLSLLLTSTLSKLKNKTLTDDILEQNLKMSQHTMMLMSTTIGMFRNFYRFDDNISQFSLNKCIESVIQVLNVDFNRKNISIKYTIDDDFYVISVDNFIQQILLVLLQNAKDALLTTHKKYYEKIQISVLLKGDLVIIDISDWGEGISKQVKTKLFDNIKSSKKDLGSGIGLYFARKVAREKLEGDLILVQSFSPTTFRFSFKNHLTKKAHNNACSNA